MLKGTVFNHKNIKFHDGEYGNKLLIVLNDVSGNQPYLCCKTTSQQKIKNPDLGCHSQKNYFVIDEQPFIKKTWIQFDPTSFYELSAIDLLNAKLKGDIIIENRNHQINETSMNYILGCIAKSDDISLYHLQLLGIE